MATDKIRKYVLPNIPYLFIGWFCLKIGTAYRLAAGTGFGEKLLGLGQTIGAAFASFAPGLAPLDWFVGIVGAAGFRLLIYCKAKKAKKFRRDAEYGTARWGTEKDIKPFVNPKFENNMLLTATERLTMNTRPTNPANARNLNFCGIGSSGSGKTRFWLTPQLLQAHSSYVVVDPKGGVLGQVGSFLQKCGYKIKVFNSIDFSKSMHYNPLSYIRNEADILKFVNALITNTKGEGKEGDPFWTKAETLLYCALIVQMGVEEKDRQGFSKKKDVLKELKEKNPEGYEKVCYEIGNSFLFYYDVNVDRDRYSSAKNWFKECVKSYPIAQVYCDISDCLDLINQYSEAKVKQTDKMYEAYGTLWEKVTELKKKEEKFEDVDARLQVWSEINDIVNEQVVPFLEVTSSNDLIQLLNDISDEAGNISKSVIKEDIDELQDKIQSTIQKINAAQEAGKK